MAGSDRPEWYSLIHSFFVVFCIALIASINTFSEHKRPKKTRIVNSEKSSFKKTDSVKSTLKSHKSEKITKTLSTRNKSASPSQNVRVEPPAIKEIKDDNLYFSNLVDNYEATVLAKLNRPESRSDIVIRYYFKKKDQNTVYALRKYGFYVHERPSDSSFEEFRSNTLYYGDDVSNEDIQLVAYVLMQSGVDLKKIIPSQLHDDWKANSIEIGTDSLATNLPNLNLSDIRKNWH